MILYIRFVLLCEVSLMKCASNMFYVYLGIIVMNILVNCGLGETDIINGLTNSTSNNMIYDSKLILKISPNNSDLVEGEINTIESNNQIDSVDGNENENKSFLEDITEKFFKDYRIHFPSYFQTDGLPRVSEDAPVYGNKLVTFKSSSILQNRNLPQMSIEIPITQSMGKATELQNAIAGAGQAEKLYGTQFIQFQKVISGINNGTEVFYPDKAKSLMEQYVELTAHLSSLNKEMGKEAANQLKNLDPKIYRGFVEKNNVG